MAVGTFGAVMGRVIAAMRALAGTGIVILASTFLRSAACGVIAGAGMGGPASVSTVLIARGRAIAGSTGVVGIFSGLSRTLYSCSGSPVCRAVLAGVAAGGFATLSGSGVGSSRAAAPAGGVVVAVANVSNVSTTKASTQIIRKPQYPALNCTRPWFRRSQFSRSSSRSPGPNVYGPRPTTRRTRLSCPRLRGLGRTRTWWPSRRHSLNKRFHSHGHAQSYLCRRRTSPNKPWPASCQWRRRNGRSPGGNGRSRNFSLNGAARRLPSS